MVLNAICIIQGPGEVAMEQLDGVLYIWTKNKIKEAPLTAVKYRIEPGFNRLWIGENPHEYIGARQVQDEEVTV